MEYFSFPVLYVHLNIDTKHELELHEKRRIWTSRLLRVVKVVDNREERRGEVKRS